MISCLYVENIIILMYVGGEKILGKVIPLPMIVKQLQFAGFIQMEG